MSAPKNICHAEVACSCCDSVKSVTDIKRKWDAGQDCAVIHLNNELRRLVVVGHTFCNLASPKFFLGSVIIIAIR